MAELVRLVLRSRGPGTAHPALRRARPVLIGKWTGVYAPVLIGEAIDAAGKGRGTPETLFAVFMGLAGRLGAAAVHLQRHAADARRHLHPGFAAGAGALGRGDLRPHPDPVAQLPQGKQTGALARMIDRGAHSTDTLLQSVVFNLARRCSS
ncbi:MAG: hypothetical protein WDM85_07295 [Caulobacteraceae bacterium]